MPMPDKAVEAKGQGSGPVKTYTLSQDEVAKIFELNKVESKKPSRRIELKMRSVNVVEKQEKGTVVPSKVEFLKLRAAGATLSSIEEKWGIPKGTLSYHTRKWDIAGIQPAQAAEILAQDVVTDPKTEESATLLSASDPVREIDQAHLLEKMELLEDAAQWRHEAERLRMELAAVEDDRALLLATIERAVDPVVESITHFEELGIEIGQLVAKKNVAYGDSCAKTGDFLKLLYPNGIDPAQYGDALCLVRIFVKQMRIATNQSAFGESPYRDIAGYGILGASKGAV